MVQFLKVPVNGNENNFENYIMPAMNYLFSKLFYLSRVHKFYIGHQYKISKKCVKDF